MHVTCDRGEWSCDAEGFWVRLRVREQLEARRFLAGMKEREYSVEIREKRRRRSLDANAYCWVLLDRLSETLGVPKRELYRQMVRDVGGNCETVCVQNRAVEKLIAGWEHNGMGWVTETFPSRLPGCTNVVLYYGSSTYDTRQMSRLIDLVVQECRAQGVETMTPAELVRLKEGWDAPGN